MAGKRPDQHNISPSEGRTTDYKNLPENRHGQTNDMTSLREGDKQRLAESQQGGQPFMPDVPSPSAEANRALKTEQGQLPEDASGTAETGGENPLA